MTHSKMQPIDNFLIIDDRNVILIIHGVLPTRLYPHAVHRHVSVPAVYAD